MRRTDHAGFAIGQQHRRAIGGDDPEQHARPIGRYGIGARAVGVRPRAHHGHGIRRVDLVDRRKLRARQNGRDRAAAILRHGLGIVTGAVADVEPRDHTLRYTAAPPEETMRDRAERRGANDLDGLSQGCG